jgi:hypothetical protein
MSTHDNASVSLRGRSAGVHDALGNRFRKGQLVLVQIGQANQLAQVVEVVPPPDIKSPSGQMMPTAGRLVLQVILPLAVQSGEPVSGVWVLEQPAEELTQ